MNRKKLVTLGIVGAMLLSAGAVAVTMFDQSTMRMFGAVGEDVSTVFTLDSTNVPSEAQADYSSFSHTFALENKNQYTISYTNAQLADGAHIRIQNNGGSIEKTDVSKGIKKITLSVDGVCWLMVSDNADWTGTYYRRLVQTSDNEKVVTVTGNYWKVVSEANNDTTIKKLVVEYSCSSEAPSPTSDGVVISSFKTTNNFISFTQSGEDIWFSFSAYANKNYNENRLYPSDIKLLDQNREITPDYIEYRNSTEVEVYFNLDRYYRSIMSNETPKISNYAPHLYVRGSVCTAYNDAGDLRIDQTGLIQTGDYYNGTAHYVLSLPSWGQMPYISIQPNFEIKSRRNDDLITKATYEHHDDRFVLNMVSAAGSIKDMKASSFDIRNEDASIKFVADQIIIGDDYEGAGFKFQLVFNTINFYNKWKQDEKLEFYCHLFINGTAYDNATGNLYTNEVKESPDGHGADWAWKSYNYISNTDDGAYNIYYSWECIILQVVGR